MSKAPEPQKDQQKVEPPKNEAAADTTKNQSSGIDTDSLLNFSELKPGEYSIHVYVERTRCLTHPENDTELVDPMVCIQSLGKKQYTGVRKRVGPNDKFWGEHLYIEKNIANKEEIKNGKLLIEVIDYNSVTKNCLVGNYEMDLASVYFEKDHSLQYKWLALTNIKKNYSKIMGYIKLSVSVLRAGDKQVLLQEEPPRKANKSDKSENQVMLPPQLQQKPGQIVFKLFKAEALKKMDTFYSIDAYVVLECGGFSLKSDTVMDNKNPTWFKEMWVPLFQPTVNQNLTLKLWDYDRGSDDELVGCCNFNLKQIIDGELEDPFWCNIYGSPYDCAYKDEMNIMNNNPDLGTYWSGRILCAISYLDVEEPQCTMKPLSKQDVDTYKVNDDMTYGITVDAFYGIDLPDNKKYSLTVRWADQLVATKKIEAKNYLIEWNERVKLDCTLPYRSSDTLPDVFIYLTDSDGKCVSYVREKAKKFMISQDMNPRNYFMVPDKSMTKIRADEAGVINATITIEIEGCTNKPNPLLEQAKKIKPKQTMLHFNLYQCQDLIPGDSNGTSDPFCEVHFYGSTIKFPTKKDTNNPIWYKSQQIQVNQYNESNPPPILIRFFDEDTVSNDFLGSALIDIQEGIKQGYIGKSAKDTISPRWVDLKFNRNSQCGRALVSMFFDDTVTSKPQIYDLRPKLEKYRIQVKILGLRNLKSYGPMPVRRPYIKFDINSLKGIGESKNASKNLFTEPKGFGSNPTISTIIKFDCLLPEDLILMPSLSCTVYDKILFGLIQPIVGQFSINLREYVQKTKERQAQKYKKTTTFQGDTSSSLMLSMPLKSKQESTQLDSKNSKQDITIDDKANTLKEGLLQEVKEQHEEHIEEEHQAVIEIDNLKQVESQQDEHILKIDPYQIYDDSKKIINKEGQIVKDYTIFWAHYTFDKESGEIVENNPPDPDCYYSLSYDNRINKLNSIRVKETNKPLPSETAESTGLVKEGEVVNYATNNQVRKHYRYIVHSPLEESIFIEKNVFDVIEISQCRRFNENDMYNDMVLSFGNTNQAGKFKGIISVVNHNDTKLMDQVQSDKQEERDKDFMSEKYVLVRLYVLEAVNIPNADELDESDPYLIVRLGDQKISTRKRFIKDNCNPKFYEMFEFKTCLPGDPLLKIQLWDYDELSADDFLCETVIDLEDRFYSKRWRKLTNPPIETRPLYHYSSSVQKGELRLWLEIIPGTEYERVKTVYHIQNKPTQEFELRVVVWSVSDIPAQDVEDTSDLFVVARVGNMSKQTDIHFRAQSGEGNFNWRMKFPITLPTKDPAIHFQVFDKDIFSPDDFISSVSIDFQKEALAAFENDRRIKMYGNRDLDATLKMVNLTKKKFDKIEFPMTNIKKSDSFKLQFKQEGKIVISFELVPKSEADHDPVGNGRSEPNHSPHLPAPAGRFKWSWNPYTIFCQMVGPKMRAKVCFLLCAIICCLIFVMTLPAIIGQAIEDKLSE
ncbi:hypothetical protein ABPG74_001255 [Tetrahymena malaccensis]